MRTNGPSTAVGVGGWLALLTFGLLVLGPLFGAGQIYTEFRSRELQSPALKGVEQWVHLRTATWLTHLAASAVSVYAGWGLWRGNRWSVVQRAQIALWVIGPLGAIVQGLVVPIITFGSTPGFNASQLIAPLTGPFVRSLLGALVWTAYLSRSKRVRATYSLGAESGLS